LISSFLFLFFFFYLLRFGGTDEASVPTRAEEIPCAD